MMTRLIACAVLVLAIPGSAPAQEANSYRVLATTRTSTMQQEMRDAGDAGYRYAAVMGGETAIGGKEVVVVMQRTGTASTRYEYRLLATNKTSTMQKEIQDSSDDGYQYVGQTVFESAFGGKEVVCILERDRSVANPVRYEYRLLATTKTSTMARELQALADGGYDVVGLTVAKTLIGGNELVTIARRPAAPR